MWARQWSDGLAMSPGVSSNEQTLLGTVGRDDLAVVHLLRLGPHPDEVVEVVDALDPRSTRSEKTCILLSTQFGCPVGCLPCDAGGRHFGDLTAEQMLAQVAFVLERRPEIHSSKKIKIHLARSGEPSLNDQTLVALERLPRLIPSRALLPCVSTIAPVGRERYFERLATIRDRLFRGRFQLQISLDTTDEVVRSRLKPWPLLSLERVASLGERFFSAGERKVVLNFALAVGVPFDPGVLAARFDPERFLVKLTPVNPSERARSNAFESILSSERRDAAARIVEELASRGMECVVSIGEPEEVALGCNCGQLAWRWSEARSLALGAASED
jgi:23S rRNA (adenine2503-C2)-methyltransferase